MLEYNLQFFAKDGPGGEKTEPANDKKLSDARSEGQVAKSKEITNAFGLLSLFLMMKVYIGSMGNRFLGEFHTIYTQIPELVKMYDGEMPMRNVNIIFKSTMLQMLILLAPVFIIGVFVAFVCDLLQVKWKPTTKPLRPKFSKLNPIKLVLIGSVVKSYLENKVDLIFLLYDISLNQGIVLIGELVIDLGIRVSAVYLIIGFADYLYQKHKFKEDMKMTKQEVKDEYKNAEGDPAVKGKQKQRMREASMRRMMQSLPQADVVITNPTHYAVAIKYDAERYDAPMVLAKGEDYLAQRIKDIARENHIEIVENKPLARMLYANVEVGEFIPPELYQAVAEVLAFVYHLQGKA